MNTRCALAIAASLALPAAAAADGDDGGGRWSVGVGLAVPAFAVGDGAADLPPFLVLSAPFRPGGLRVEPELGLGSNWGYRPATSSPGHVILRRFNLPLEQRWYRLGLTVAPEWEVASGARLHAGPRLAALLRRTSWGLGEEDWSDAYDVQLDASAGGELALAPGVAFGAALRFGWTAFDVFDSRTRTTGGDVDGVFAGEALLALRVAL